MNMKKNKILIALLGVLVGFILSEILYYFTGFNIITNVLTKLFE